MLTLTDLPRPAPPPLPPGHYARVESWGEPGPWVRVPAWQYRVARLMRLPGAYLRVDRPREGGR